MTSIIIQLGRLFYYIPERTLALIHVVDYVPIDQTQAPVLTGTLLLLSALTHVRLLAGSPIEVFIARANKRAVCIQADAVAGAWGA